MHENGITSCYLSEIDMQKFGTDLANQIIKNNLLSKKWASQLKKETDNVRQLMKKPIAIFLNNENFVLMGEGFDQFGAYQIAIKEVVNHLSSRLFNQYGRYFEDARKYCEKVYPELNAFMVKLAKLIAKKENYKINQIKSLTTDELRRYLNKKELPNKKLLDARYKAFGLLQSKIIIKYFSKDDIKQIELLWSQDLEVDVINGQIAFSGKIIGICKVVKDFKNTKHFQKGDILITGMTDPDYIPLMKKAGAIVTDAGGILCHAAIVAREMNKPCIIGTKIATKVLKDGDLVEVDADKGVVNILKRAKK